MAFEIERKFLVDPKKWEALNKPNPNYLKQAFIAQEDKKVVRVRITNDMALLTIKGQTHGVSRLEFEYEIPKDDAKELISNLGGPVIEKDRYEISVGNHIWEVDVFYGDNEGLVVAEIELGSENEAFQLPDWVSGEVSGDARYYNSNLQKIPFKSWR